MQIVIDIDEEIYNHMKERFMYGYADTELDKVGLAVRNGTPLQKGHGDLIDRDILKKDDETTLWLSLNTVRTGKMIKYFSELFIKKIDSADAIILADKEGD